MDIIWIRATSCAILIICIVLYYNNYTICMCYVRGWVCVCVDARVRTCMCVYLGYEPTTWVFLELLRVW